MARILDALDREWEQLAGSLTARSRLHEWQSAHAALEGLDDLWQLLDARRDATRAQGILRALAELAPDDDLAARTLLQAMIPGLVRLAQTAANDDPHGIEELVSIAWERIRTYPTSRNGSVAANVLLDTRKRYRQHRGIDGAVDMLPMTGDPQDVGRLPDDEVMSRLLIEELDAARSAGLISSTAFRSIVRTRVGGEPLAEVAIDESLRPRNLCQQRWRAECRLRQLPLAG